MPVTMLDAVEFSKIPSLNFVIPVVSADPTGLVAADEGRLIYNTTSDQIKFCNGALTWVPVVSGTGGGPPSGNAGGDLSGTYPNPEIAAGVIMNAEINASAAIAQSKIANLTTDLAAKADASALANYQATSGKGVANGYVPLDSSALIPTVHLPPLAINDVFTAASDTAMQGLTAQVGDMCIRTDTNKTYVLSAAPASTLANWKEVMATGQVVSVNSMTGVVSITLASLGGVATSRQVIAGNGLTGGGALSADVTLNVANADGTLTVAADDVKVASAPKWTTARSITLTGDVTGTVASVDGTGNISIPTTVAVAGTAPKHYAGNVGAGTAVVINHALNTRDVTVEVYRSTTPWDSVTCTVERTDVNNVTLRFATAVAANAFRCVVVGR